MNEPLVAFGRDICGDLSAATRREWLVTNGLGGSCSGTVAGVLTRRYHGLLVAALEPPGGRTVLAATAAEWLSDGDERYPLSTHAFAGGVIDPHGYRNIERFWLDGTLPQWQFAAGDARLHRQVWMRHEHNTTFVRFTLTRATRPLTLEWTPLSTCRDFHELRRAGSTPRLWEDGGQTAVQFDGDGPVLYLRADGGTAEAGSGWWWNFEHAEETARGLDHSSDLFAPLCYRVTLAPGAAWTVALSAAPLAPFDAAWELEGERQRQRALLARAGVAAEDGFRAQLVLAADQFVVRRGFPTAQGAPAPAGSPGGSAAVGGSGAAEAQHSDTGSPPAPAAAAVAMPHRDTRGANSTSEGGPAVQEVAAGCTVTASLPQQGAYSAGAISPPVTAGVPEHGAASAEVVGPPFTLIAGYPWFADWGRDTMIALPGLLLATGRPEIAATVLRSFAAFVRDGLLPNNFPDRSTSEPGYNTADASLWYIIAIERYVEATGDRLLRDELLPVARAIIDHYIAGTRYGIAVDPADGLLRAGAAGVQLTWMDAKVGDWVVTPRAGKPVEINALWYNALRIVSKWQGETNAREAARTAALATQAAASFRHRFHHQDAPLLADVVDGPDGDDWSVRPNQIFALSLPYPLLESEEAAALLAELNHRLLTTFGPRSLAADDPHYRGSYGGGVWERDGAYHQGTVWLWLLGPFVEAQLRQGGDRADALARLTPLLHHLRDAGLGTLSEIFDGDPPHSPRGAVAQAWSVAEILRVLQMLDPPVHNDPMVG